MGGRVFKKVGGGFRPGKKCPQGGGSLSESMSRTRDVSPPPPGVGQIQPAPHGTPAAAAVGGAAGPLPHLPAGRRGGQSPAWGGPGSGARGTPRHPAHRTATLSTRHAISASPATFGFGWTACLPALPTSPPAPPAGNCPVCSVFANLSFFGSCPPSILSTQSMLVSGEENTS